MTSPHPIDQIAADIPAVAQWWAVYRADPAYEPQLHRLHLAELSRFLMAESRGGALPHQPEFCKALESALAGADPDTNDALALSVIEEFIMNGPSHSIDARRLYKDLGPIAQSHWEQLYEYIRHEPWAAA